MAQASIKIDFENVDRVRETIAKLEEQRDEANARLTAVVWYFGGEAHVPHDYIMKHLGSPCALSIDIRSHHTVFKIHEKSEPAVELTGLSH